MHTSRTGHKELPLEWHHSLHDLGPQFGLSAVGYKSKENVRGVILQVTRQWKPTLAGALDVRVWTRGKDMNLAVRDISLDCSSNHMRIIIKGEEGIDKRTSTSPVDAISATPSSTRWGKCEVNAAAMAPPWSLNKLCAKNEYTNRTIERPTIFAFSHLIYCIRWASCVVYRFVS